MVRRYSVDRVYREKKVFNFHPKQYYECAFDIITPDPGNHLVDAELLSVAYEIVNEIPHLKEKVYIRINHTSLLRAILVFYNIPKNKYNEIFGSLLDYIDNRYSRFQFQSLVTSVLEMSKATSSTLIDMLLTNYQLGSPRINIERTALKGLLRGKSEAASLAKGAIRELEMTVALVQSFGVTIPIHLFPGLPVGYDHANSGGIVWQMVVDIKQRTRDARVILAFGERYDTMLSEFQKKAQTSNVNVPYRSMSGAGFSIILDKVIALSCLDRGELNRAVDVGLCICGSRAPLKDAIYTLRLLWSAGIRTGFIEASGHNEAQELAKDLGANHLILFGDAGTLRVQSICSDKFQEKNVTMTELVEYIQKLLKPDMSMVEHISQSSTNQTSNVSINRNTLNSLPTVELKFFTRITGNVRRKQENMIMQNMSSTILQFSKNEHIIVMVIDLPFFPINAITGAINPRALTKRETEKEIKHVVERFPEYRRNISEIFEEIVDLITSQSKTIVALYSTSDCSYRLII